MPIIYNKYLNTIYINGGSAYSPYTFEDIYNTDRSHRWRVFTRLTDRCYKSKAKLYFYNCYFSEINSMLLMNDVCDWYYDTIIRITDGSNIDFNECHFQHYEHKYVGGWEIDGNVSMKCKNCSWMSTKNSTKSYLHVQPNNPDNVLFQNCQIGLYVKDIKGKMVDSILCGENGYFMYPTEHLLLENTNVLTENSYCFIVNVGNITINGGKYDAANALCQIVSHSSITFKNSELLKTNIVSSLPNNSEADFKVAYDIRFKVTDENNKIANKKIKIIDNNDNVVFDDYIPEQPIELLKYSYHIVGDGNEHEYDTENYIYYLPYKIEIYDELQTYYEGYINELNNSNRSIELNISIPDRNIFNEINELKEALQAHRDAVEPKIDTTISSRASQTSVDVIPTNPLLDNDTRLNNLDAPISSRSSHTPEDVWTYSNRELSNPDNYKADISNLALESTVQTFKTEVEDMITSHGNNLQAHRNVVEPKIDTTISSRASQTSVDDLSSNILVNNDPRLDNLDAPISSRSSHTPEDVWTYSNRELSNPDNYKADISNLALESTVQSIKNQTDKLEFNENNYVKSDAQNPEISNLDTTISSRASQASVDVIPTNPLLDNDIRLNNLDATISSRSSHTPEDIWTYSNRELSNPDNYKADVSNLALESTVQSIKSQTDKLEFNENNYVKSECVDGCTAELSQETEAQIDNIESVLMTHVQQLNDHRDTVESKIDTTISSRASQTSVDAIPTNPLLDNDVRLNNLDATISSRSSHTPEDVWTYSNRELSNPDNYKADISNLALESTVQSIKSQTDKLEFNDENNRVKAECIANSSGEIPSETEAQIDNIESMLVDHIEQLRKHDKKIFNKLITNG